VKSSVEPVPSSASPRRTRWGLRWCPKCCLILGQQLSVPFGHCNRHVPKLVFDLGRQISVPKTKQALFIRLQRYIAGRRVRNTVSITAPVLVGVAAVVLCSVDRSTSSNGPKTFGRWQRAISWARGVVLDVGKRIAGVF
jgi:hypothetical protein